LLAPHSFPTRRSSDLRHLPSYFILSQGAWVVQPFLQFWRFSQSHRRHFLQIVPFSQNISAAIGCAYKNFQHVGTSWALGSVLRRLFRRRFRAGFRRGGGRRSGLLFAVAGRFFGQGGAVPAAGRKVGFPQVGAALPGALAALLPPPVVHRLVVAAEQDGRHRPALPHLGAGVLGDRKSVVPVAFFLIALLLCQHSLLYAPCAVSHLKHSQLSYGAR